MPVTPLVRTRGASFGYDDVPVVTGIDLTVDDGEVVALLGPNGSGKSTLVRGLLGLVPHLGGQVELFGTPLAAGAERHRIGYVPQRHTLANAVRSTVTEIVATGRLTHRRWWQPTTTTDRRHVREALDLVGLSDRATDEVSTLSGGQQRRVLIARALAADPDLLVMDEPTAGVDQGNQVVLGQLFAELAARGASMLVVTHELDALESSVTRIVCLDGGRVDFDGTPAAYAAHHLALGAHPVGSGYHHEHHEHRAHTPAGRPLLGSPALLDAGPLLGTGVPTDDEPGRL